MRRLVKWFKKHQTYILIGIADVLLAAGLAVTIGVLTKPEAIPEPVLPPPKVEMPLNPPKVELVKFASGLTDPTAIVSHPGDLRLFVLDRSGVIRVINPDGTVTASPFLDIRAKVLGSAEMGLLGMAFSPNYSKDKFFFINYVDKQQNTVIARYHASSADLADPASEQVVLTLKQPYTNHNGGALAFSPDGYLYAALGDGGSGGDPENRAQDVKSLFGKILRLDVSQLPYKIPTDNPFTSNPEARGEIWTYGLRNPWRISFDRQTGDMYIADVGQGDIEEINFEPVGSNGGIDYGWRCFEGSKDFNLNDCGPRDKYIFPILEYDHAEGRCSVTGGYVYRGEKYPALDGRYFYGDFCGGQLYMAQKQADKWETALITKSTYKISTFGEDADGELYLADFATGDIYQIQDSAN